MIAHERGARTRAQGTHDVTTPTHTTRVGALPQSHPGLCGTLVGAGKDTHGTPVPLRRKAVGGPTATPRDDPRQTCFQRNQVLTHLETDMVAKPVRETGDPRRAVTLRERTCRLRVKVETSRIIKKIGQRNETHHP